MDDTSAYDNIEYDVEHSSPNSTKSFVNNTDTVCQTEQEHTEEAVVYSTLTFVDDYKPVVVNTQKERRIPEARAYPKLIVCLCVLAGIIIPFTIPFVIYYLLRSRLDWKRGDYNQAYRRANQAANVTLVCVISFVTVLLIVVLVVSIVAFQQTTKQNKYLNTTINTEHLKTTKERLQSDWLSSLTSSPAPNARLNQSVIPQFNSNNSNNNNNNSSRMDSGMNNTSPNTNMTGDQVFISTPAHKIEPVTTPDVTPKHLTTQVDTINFGDRMKTERSDAWIFEQINKTHIYTYNIFTHVKKVQRIDSFQIPDQGR